MKLWTVVSNSDDGIVAQIATTPEAADLLASEIVSAFWSDMRSDPVPEDWLDAMEVLTTMPTFMDGVYVQEHEVEPIVVGLDLASSPDETAVIITQGPEKLICKTRCDLMQLPEFADLDTDSDGNPCVWENHYSCRDCTSEQIDWSSNWSCQCNDECPHCGNEIELCDSVWIGPTDDVLRSLWESLPEGEGQGWGGSTLPAPDPLREAYEDTAAQMEVDGIAREEERQKLREQLDGDQWSPEERQKRLNQRLRELVSPLHIKTEGIDPNALAADLARDGMIIMRHDVRDEQVYSFRVPPKVFLYAENDENEADAEIVTRSAPRWAWEIIDETLDADSRSKAFDPNLRAMIRAATVAMQLACESANDEPISRERVNELVNGEQG